MATRRERAAYFLLRDRPARQWVETAPAILDALADPVPRVRMAAALAGFVLLEEPRPAIAAFVELAADPQLRAIAAEHIGWVWPQHPRTAWSTFEQHSKLVMPLLLDLARSGTDADLRLLFTLTDGMEQAQPELLEALRPLLNQPEHQYFGVIEDAFWRSDPDSLRDHLHARLNALAWQEADAYHLLNKLKHDPQSHPVVARWLLDQMGDEYENHLIVLHFKELPQGVPAVHGELLALAERQPPLAGEIALALATNPTGMPDALRLAAEALATTRDAQFVRKLEVFGPSGASLAGKIVERAEADPEFRYAACSCLPALAPNDPLVRKALRRWRDVPARSGHPALALLRCGDTSAENVSTLLAGLSPWGGAEPALTELARRNLLDQVPDDLLVSVVRPGHDDEAHALALAAARALAHRGHDPSGLVHRLDSSRAQTDRVTARRMDELLVALETSPAQ